MIKNDTKITSKSIQAVLPNILGKISSTYENKTSRVFDEWPEIIGKKLAPMTKILSLKEGILTVQVKSSTLLSLLVGHEKARILTVLQEKFSKKMIQNIVFRIG